MNRLALMLVPQLTRGIPVLVIRIPIEGRLWVGTTCPPSPEQDRLWDWIHHDDNLTDLLVHAFELLPLEDE